MPQKHPDRRTLPRKHNPLLAPEQTPECEDLIQSGIVTPEHLLIGCLTDSELVNKRRLGQTNLSVRAGQVGISNATKPENLGMFDYVHLRAPLPENLKGSEIFAPQAHQSNPEAYFLMRRSSDGFVSATGMFKAAFPWAKHSEEQAERDYIKSLDTTGQDEVAGNVWIPEAYALELAEEYGILPWIAALLDEAEVAEVKNMDDQTKAISPPPKFMFKANDMIHLPPPNARTQTPRPRGRPRVGSPTKNGATKNGGTPRKSRSTKATNAASAATAREAASSLQPPGDNTASVADSESVDGERVIVEVESNVQVNGAGETTTTNVRIDMPGGSADLPLPQKPEEMIEQAKEMVAEAVKLEGESSSKSKSLKRKAEVLDDSEDEPGDRELQPAKRARLLSEALKKERVRKRALIGVVTTLAIGAIMPFVL
ncbi:hypothetical protein MMC07_002064 [Pseudocyphellaria aurata]|nr:hypothetical protein [Pseudocyphellaria aurata]